MQLNTQNWLIRLMLLSLQVLILISCSNQSSIKKHFVNDENNYWMLYDEAQPGSIGEVSYKFYSNGTYKIYRWNLDGSLRQFKSDGDVIFNDSIWSVSNDSILTWDHQSYDIVDYNENTITLYLNRYDRYIFLFKLNEDSNRKGIQYYVNKRRKYPEKYPEPYSSGQN